MAYAALSTIQTIATGQVFTAATLQQANDNDEFLIDPPACSVYGSAAQTLTTDTLTAMNANSELYDNNSMHSTSTNTSRITCQTAGRYWVSGSVIFATNGTSERSIEFRKNGTTQYLGLKVNANTAGSQNTVLSAVRTVVLAAGDYIEVMARQRSGGNLDCSLDEFAAMFITR